MKYEYKSETIKVKDFDLKIFKNGASPMKEGVYVSIEKVENQPNTLFVIVRNRTTKLSVFKGIVVKRILKMENFLGKKENLRFSILKTEKSKKEEKDGFDLVKDVVKLQFMHEEDC